MTKQEGIREGIAEIIQRGYDPGMPIMDMPQRIMHYLHSQGVVIKVDIGGGYSDIEPLMGGEMKNTKIIIENVRGQWVVDKATTGAFQEEGTGYGDGALMEIEVANHKSLCCHPDNPAVCSHNK